MDFTQVTDKSLNDNVEKLLSVKSDISNVENKIKLQKDEMLKTIEIIEQFQNCYKNQDEALKKFIEEHRKLSVEYERLFQTVNTNNVLTNEEPKKCVNITESQCIRKIEAIESSKSLDEVKFIDSNSNNSLLPILSSGAQKLTKKNHISNPGNQKTVKKKRVKLELMSKAKKSKSSQSKETAVNILVKVHSFPLEIVTSFKKNRIVCKIFVSNNDIYACGSQGLLVNQDMLTTRYYTGHQKNLVTDFYIYNNQRIYSLAQNYVLISKLLDCTNFKKLTTFRSQISCSCVYNNNIYGSLDNGDFFIVNMKEEKVDVFQITKKPIESMVVVKLNGSKLLITANLKGEVISYSLNSDSWLQVKDQLKINGKLKGMLADNSFVVCFTDHNILLLDKSTWKISLVREITNEILFFEANMNNLIVLDSYNILHKYIIKKGKIRPGSTVENLSIKDPVSAVHFNHIMKKLYFATGNVIYKQSF